MSIFDKNIVGITIHDEDSRQVILYTDQGDEVLRNTNSVKNKLGIGKFNRLLKD